MVYTGKIDEFFDYKYGELEYWSLHFDTKILPLPDFQRTAVMNYTGRNVPFTRITEYKYFEMKKLDHTIISTEYSEAWNRNKTPYYPCEHKSER
ncbi:MAG: hypothetical protein H0X29_06900 [Parachlamydiaceae bacterium]|nr:hypothetical protein [Parachlamydiaceae bacterium]